MHRQACFNSGMHSNDRGPGISLPELNLNSLTTYRFFSYYFFFFSYCYYIFIMFPLRTMSFSRFGIVCFFIVFVLFSLFLFFVTVIYIVTSADATPIIYFPTSIQLSCIALIHSLLIIHFFTFFV